MATTELYTQEAIRWSNFTNIQSNVSSFLAKYCASRGILSLTDFAENPKLDLQYQDGFINDANMIGFEYFAKYCEVITFPKTLNTAISNGNINISEFINLKVIDTKSKLAVSGSNPQFLAGDMTRFTKLTYLDTVFVSNPYIPTKLPILSNNINLTTVRILGSGLQSQDLNTLGNLQSNLLLSELSLTYINMATIALRAMVDNILSTLKTAKQAGGVISKIDFTAGPAPTGGTSNSDYIWLTNNGVSVTLGTL